MRDFAEHVIPERREGSREGTNMLGGMRRQVGRLQIERQHILAHTLKTETSVLGSHLKLSIYEERS